jgi:hypothetical protein
MIWQDQCDAARDIKRRFGSAKALGYLIGEKLVNHVRASDTQPPFAQHLPSFIAEVSSIFTTAEIRDYLDSVNRIGAPGHVCSDEEHDLLRAHDAVEENPVTGAEDIPIMERIRELLLEDGHG